MKIAYTFSTQRGHTDLLLYRLAEDLRRRGLRPAGVVQINSERADGQPCDMDLKVLPDGSVIRISQSLGAGAKGCRLDAGALEGAVASVRSALTSADCVIINKFGKREAEGGGFRETIAEAIALDLPVIVGLNELNSEAFHSFSEGWAIELQADLQDLSSWVLQSASREVHA